MKKNLLKITNASLALIMLLVSLPINAKALTKDETVYGKFDNTGKIKSVYVNERLINNTKESELKDYTELKEIFNLNGDETFNIDGSSIVWNSNGNDIFYQGKYENDLPVTLKITYKLDGKETNVSDMLGKSGKVDITIKYTNNDKHSMLINGKYETLYTPFVVMFGTSINETNTSNITINNGKVVSNGSKNFIVGISTPGLYESLKISNFKDLDTIKISYDTTCFELGSIYSVITPKVIDESDLKIFDKIDDLSNKVNTLQKNTDLIESNTLKLYNGSSLIRKNLLNSINNLKNNSGNVLNEKELEAISTKVVNETNKTFTDDYKVKLGESTWKTVSASLKSSDEVTNKVTSITTSSVSNAVVDYLKSVGEYEDYVKCEMGDSTSCQVIASDKTLPYVKAAALKSSSETAKNVSSYVSNYTAEKVTKTVAPLVAQTTALETSKSVSKNVASEVANSVKEASIQTVSSSLKELYDGISKLDDGLKELSDGITKYNNEGIKSISKLVNGDVKNISARVKALTKLSNDYKTIQSTKKVNGSTKLIYVIDSENYVPNKVVDNVTETKLTFWDRVKNLFK